MIPWNKSKMSYSVSRNVHKHITLENIVSRSALEWNLRDRLSSMRLAFEKLQEIRSKI